MPSHPAFGGGVTESTVTALVLALMLFIIVMVFFLPRKWTLGPLMFGIFLVPFGQTFVLGGLHISVMRVLILAGLIRAFASRPSEEPLFAGGSNVIDKALVVGTVYGAIAFILRYPEMGAVANQLGIVWDGLGGYFLVRLLIRYDDDIQRTIKVLSAIAAVLAITMLYEKMYDANLYSVFTVRKILPEIRNGSIRAQGPFHHAILAGCFGATLVPLFLWMWKRSKLCAIVGIIASTAIVGSCASSTPVSAYLAVILGFFLWPLRKSMRLIRWGIVLAIFTLNLMMHAPVWWAIEHIDLAGGSASEHRAELIDNFVRHFSEWWFIGTSNNASWGFEMWDISNGYVAQGEGGGLVPLICMITVITVGFKKLGISRRSVEGSNVSEWYFWILGIALFSHVVAFFGISYFDQTQFSWYALLATISVATQPQLIRKLTPEEKVDAEVTAFTPA